MLYTVYMHIAPNGKKYIGITCQDPSRRWRNGSGYKKNRHFFAAINKFGWKNIRHEVLFEGLTEAEAKEREIEMIAFFRSNDPKYGYNITAGGDGNYQNLTGEERARRDLESKRRWRARNKDYEVRYSKARYHSPEYKAHMREYIKQEQVHKRRMDYQRKYRAKHHDEVLERQRIYRAKNREKINRQARERYRRKKETENDTDS